MPPASSAERETVALPPVYRYVSFGVKTGSGQWALEHGRVALIADGGVREVVSCDGSVALGANPEGERLKGAMPIPVRLGGGFLFWGKALYRAPFFTSPLQLIAADLPAGAMRMEFGPTDVRLLLADSPPKAFALEPPRTAGREANAQALASSPANVPARILEDRAYSRWVRAFRDGMPLPGARAWLGDGRDLVLIDLTTGAVSSPKRLGSEESSCTPVSMEDEGLVVCVNRFLQKTSTAVISHALSAEPVTERTFQGAPRFSWGNGLSVLASCSGVPAPASACARRPGGTWAEFNVPDHLLQKWVLYFWVPREAGGLSAVLGTFERPQNQYKMALFNPATGQLTPWDGTEAVGANSNSFGGSSYIEFADGRVRGFTRSTAIAVEPNGHVTAFAQSFASIASAGRHALARDDAENLWQTSDYGRHWRQVARPSADDVPEGGLEKSDPRPSGQASRIDCSPAGCAIEHRSGTGIWLRAGWPE